MTAALAGGVLAAEPSATPPSPCPEGTQALGARPPEGDKSGCARSVDDHPVLEGPQTIWYPGGTKRQETYYKNGKPSGPKYDWGIRGNLMQKWEFVDGVLQGEHVIYSPAGSILLRETYVNGRATAPEHNPKAPEKAPAKKFQRRAEKRAEKRPVKKPEKRAEKKLPRPVAQRTEAPRTHAFVCELRADAIDGRIAGDERYFADLTHGQLRLIHMPSRLNAEIRVGGPEGEAARVDGALSYRLEATNELGMSSNDPVQEEVRQHEAAARKSVLQLERWLSDLLRQWKGLMSDSAKPPVPAPDPAGEALLREADLQQVAGEALPSKLTYSVGGSEERQRIVLSGCRRFP